MELAYLYVKTRNSFGSHCDFIDTEANVLESIPSTTSDSDHVIRRPMILKTDTTPDMSEHEANTERQVTRNSSMRHMEGGWPKDVDPAEQSDVQRYRKKVEKDDEFKVAIVKALGPMVDKCLRQNNTINIYQNYFESFRPATTTEQPNAKGLAVFRDPEIIKRTVSTIDWHPECAQKMAASYSVLHFQDTTLGLGHRTLPTYSYVWDVSNPNTPETILRASSPLICMRYNPKAVDQLIAGAYNGVVTFFDVRKNGGTPVDTCSIEYSHHDPVYDVFWISSKTGNQCVSVSTDGRMLWWDIRHLTQPTHEITLDTQHQYGGSCMEYNAEAGPTKYLVGTEQGAVLSVNLRNSKQNNGVSVFDTAAGKHHGPIYSIQRNPAHNKFFMTIGDWTARLWCEDLKTPIMSTAYHDSYVTAGCWSPSRAGVFLVTRMDGVVDVWDYFHRQNEVAYSHKVGDVALSTVAVQGNAVYGSDLFAVGDCNGMISLMQLSDGLASIQPNEKNAIGGMFERETKREKNLESKEKEMRRKRAANEELKAAQEDGFATIDDKMEQLLRTVDANFLSMIKEAEDSENENLEHKSVREGDW